MAIHFFGRLGLSGDLLQVAASDKITERSWGLGSREGE